MLRFDNVSKIAFHEIKIINLSLLRFACKANQDSKPELKITPRLVSTPQIQCPF